MKHAVKQRKATVKPKTKSLTSVKAIAKPNSTTNKTGGKIASDRRVIKLDKKTEIKVENTLKTAKVYAKPALEKTASKLSAKTLKANKTVSSRKPKLIVKQIEKPKTKKIVSKLPAKSATAIPTKISVKRNKVVAPKIKLAAKTKKTAVESKIVKPVAKQKLTSKVLTVKTTKPVKNSVNIDVKTAKAPIGKKNVQKTKHPTLTRNTVASTAKINGVSKKVKQAAKPQKLKTIKKTKPAAVKPPKKEKNASAVVKAKNVEQKLKKNLIGAPKQPKKKLIAAKSAVETKKIVARKTVVKSDKVNLTIKPAKTAVEKVEFTPVAPSENIVWKRLKPKPAISSAKAVEEKQKLKKSIVAEKIEPIAVVEEVKPQPLKAKKGKPIGSAVFRGKNERYDFKVFALNDIFDPIPAVYIISKRKTDRNKRGHHSLVCIGQTASILDELKRHRKGKCVKKHAANVISILPEADEKMRLKIETDLKAAHTVVCNFG